MKRSDFRVVDTKTDEFGRVWTIGVQGSPVHLTDEILITTSCRCGEELCDTVTALEVSSTAKHNTLLSQCNESVLVPIGVRITALEEARIIHERNLRIRSEGGGSRQGIPDC